MKWYNALMVIVVVAIACILIFGSCTYNSTCNCSHYSQGGGWSLVPPTIQSIPLDGMHIIGDVNNINHMPIYTDSSRVRSNLTFPQYIDSIRNSK